MERITRNNPARRILRALGCCWLIPVFFVVHGYADNFGMILPAPALQLMLAYIMGVSVVFVLVIVLEKKLLPAILITVLLSCFYFFFGAVYDFLKEHAIPFYSYKYLVPIFLILIVFTHLMIRRYPRYFTRMPILVATIFFVYILIDLGRIGVKSLASRAVITARADSPMSVYCQTCPRPDIYLLVFDEYASSFSLEKNYGFSNRQLDTFLQSNHFVVSTHSYSNYNFTFFSMASMLNMEYLTGVSHPGAVTQKDYTYSNRLIADNKVIKFLENRGYAIFNYSLFDLDKRPATVSAALLPFRSNLISGQTFFSRLRKDLTWLFDWKSTPLHLLVSDKAIFRTHTDNLATLDSVRMISKKVSIQPRFIYAHFLMPHPPCYADANGKLISGAEVLRQMNHRFELRPYLNYLPYVNQKIVELVSAIQLYTKGKAVILVMGDHGFRLEDSTLPRSHFFENLNAVYLPRGYRADWPDSSSNVNQFGRLFNILYDQKFPILKDSMIYLADRKPANYP